MTAEEAIRSLSLQIKLTKQNMTSENSDYLTGYLCALSAVEGMIAEVRPHDLTVLEYLKGKTHEGRKS